MSIVTALQDIKGYKFTPTFTYPLISCYKPNVLRNVFFYLGWNVEACSIPGYVRGSSIPKGKY